MMAEAHACKCRLALRYPALAICMLCDRLFAWTVTVDAGWGSVGTFGIVHKKV